MLIITAEFANRGVGFLIRVPNANANVDQLLDSIYEEFEVYSLHYKGEIGI